MFRRLFALFDRLMGGQWGCPRGPLGRLVAILMERGNAAMNDLALEALDAQQGDAVLEIGFGPGSTLERIAEQVGERGSVAGIDPSALMVRQAGRRLRRRVDAGRAELLQGYSSSMVYADATFDRVLSVNTIYFWQDPQADIREVRRVVKPSGRFVLVFRGSGNEGGGLVVHGMPHPTAVAEVVAWMKSAGFTDVTERTRQAPFGPETVTAVALAGRGGALA